MPVDDDTVAKAKLLDRIYASTAAVEIANKAVISRYVEATNQGELDVLDELVVEDYVEHDPVPGQKPGRAGLKEAYTMFNTPFPDLRFVFDDVIAEGDLVVGRGVISGTHEGEFFGIPATGRRITVTGIGIDRVVGCRVAERWLEYDQLGMLQQLGVLPPPASASR